MAEDNKKCIDIVSAIEKVMGEYGFDYLQHFGDAVMILYRVPGMGNELKIQNTIRRIIEQHRKTAVFEWSETNLQRLSITLLEPNDEHLFLPQDAAEATSSTVIEEIPNTQHSAASPPIVPGTIGANINGRTKIYVPGSNNEEVYVTLTGQGYHYIECDIDPSATDVSTFSGFKVLVNLVDKTSVAADK
jgi:hypothetical protein